MNGVISASVSAGSSQRVASVTWAAKVIVPAGCATAGPAGRKRGVPGCEGRAMGAGARGGVRVLNDEIVKRLRIPDSVIEAVAAWEQQELVRRERLYHGDRPPPDVHGRTVILVDDGLATGASMRAAVAAVRRQGPSRVVVAVPAAAPDTCALLRAEVDELVCLITPEPFEAVGLWYEDFSQTDDEEVRHLLERAAQERSRIR